MIVELYHLLLYISCSFTVNNLSSYDYSVKEQEMYKRSDIFNNHDVYLREKTEFIVLHAVCAL